MTTLRIGVTGHRTIDDPAAVAREVRRALALATARIAPAGSGDSAAVDAAGEPAGAVCVEVVSALAEGADRLVAHVILEEPGATLTVVLPFAQDDYFDDFVTPESKSEFLELLGRAARVQVAPPTESREEGYELAGRLVVEASDAMIAVWDGEPSRGRGGTAEIVDYAREKGVRVYWIATNGEGVRLTEL
jgi:hypothetical protein